MFKVLIVQLGFSGVGMFFFNGYLLYLIFLFSTSKFYGKLWVLFEYKINEPDGKKLVPR